MVTVIIPVFNGALHIRNAIASVLSQSVRDLELIVVDDGSTDNTVEVVKTIQDPRLRILQQPNQGASIARNKGIQESKGEYLSFLDADDFWVPNKLELQLHEINKEPSNLMVYGLIQEFLDSSITGEDTIKPYGNLQTGYSSIILLIRKSDFLKAGFFDQRWAVAEFIDWYDRAKAIGLKDVVIQENLAFRRIHKGNVDRLRRTNVKQYVAVLKESLDRKRKNNLL